MNTFSVSDANVVLLTSGAGMSAACGLGTFRGANAGTWPGIAVYNAQRGDRPRVHSFCELTTPKFLEESPEFAYAFWKWRYTQYRGSTPHEGYTLLLEALQGKRVINVTSNIDGLWEKAGCEEVHEIHGSVMRNQCSKNCGAAPWPSHSDYAALRVDEERFQAESKTFPRCRACGAPARPSVTMFSDYSGPRSTDGSIDISAVDLVIEIGCGKGVPTLRLMGERAVVEGNARLVRISLEDAVVDSRTVPHHRVKLIKGDAVAGIKASLSL